MRPYVLLCFCLFLSACSQASVEPIRVGHATPLSGSDRAIGVQAQQGILLAVEAANKDEERVLGRKVSVEHADTASNRDVVRAVVWRLLTVNKVAALLGGADVAGIDQLGAIAQSHGAPMILSNGWATRPLSDFVFHTGLKPARRGEVLGRYASKELKGKVAVLDDGDASHAAAVDAFVRELPKERLAGRWSYKSGEPAALKAVVDLLWAARPEAILLAGPAADSAAVGRAVPEEKVPLLFAGAEGSLAVLQSPPSARKIFLVTAFVADPHAPAARAFIADYQQRFGALPDVHAALAHDDARLLFEAMRRAKSVEGLKVRDALRELTFEGLTGPLVFDKEHTVARPAFLVSLHNGQAKTLQRYDPEK